MSTVARRQWILPTIGMMFRYLTANWTDFLQPGPRDMLSSEPLLDMRSNLSRAMERWIHTSVGANENAEF